MKIFITQPIPRNGIGMLKERGYSIRVRHAQSPIPRKELLKAVRGVDALLCFLTDTIDSRVMEASGSQLKVISNYAVGYDNIDVKAATARGVFVANTPCIEVNNAVAEHTFSLILALAHRIVEGDAFVRAKKYKGWDPNLFIGRDLYGATLGLIGLGGIGKGVAKRVQGIGMNVLYYDVRRDELFEKEYGATHSTLEHVLKSSDVVSLHVPLLPSTHHIINTKTLRYMKKDALLINTARGGVVDQNAVMKALKGKRLGGFALDVFECEPSIDCKSNSGQSLRNFPQVIMTPHIASATLRAREAMARISAENIIEACSGQEPKHRVKI